MQISWISITWVANNKEAVTPLPPANIMSEHETLLCTVQQVVEALISFCFRHGAVSNVSAQIRPPASLLIDLGRHVPMGRAAKVMANRQPLRALILDRPSYQKPTGETKEHLELPAPETEEISTIFCSQQYERSEVV